MVSEIYEIAYSAANNRLCLFTGTGFSKALTDDKAPSWQSLLEQACDELGSENKIKNSLFPEDGSNPLSLEEAAQVIYTEYQKEGLDLHKKIAEIIAEIKCSGDNESIKAFFKERIVKVITTNYDKLIENIVPPHECQSIVPGLPIPRSSAKVKVYHVHGSIDSPKNMVVTSDDYFNFINHDSYFSKKLSSLLYENAIVILGYSLGDTNLKAIINEYRHFSQENFISSSMFLISKNKVEPYLKDYYFVCYGIRVLDQQSIHDFFEKLNKKIAEVESRLESSRKNIEKVLNKKAEFSTDFLRVEQNFYEITASLSAIGISIQNKKAMKMFGKIIKEKIELTKESGAWDQYVHLANWLIHLGGILEIKGTILEENYLNAVTYSMENMSRKLIIGRSWYAYKAWEAKWSSIMVSNRTMLKKHVEQEINTPDSLNIVNLM